MYKQKLNKLANKSNDEIDEVISQAHNNAFHKINCLDCANCCKTKGPMFNKKDINRISRHIGITPPEFSDKYLEFNENDDYVLKSTPCVFLGKDNYCSIYEVRPKACASYPHTDSRKTRHLFDYMMAHKTTCPAIEDILENI